MAGPSPDAGAGREAASLAQEAARFQPVLLEDSRSTVLSKLFSYLLERSGDERAPKEIEIAMEVFGKGGGFNTSQNSMVRGHVHRLRQRLERFYDGTPGPRLVIPRGEYRLILTEAPDQASTPEAISAPGPIAFFRRMSWRQKVALALGVNAALWAAAFMLVSDAPLPSPSPLAETDFWKPLVANGRSSVIAVGDFYLVGQSETADRVERLIMHRSIQSGNDIEGYLLQHPQQKGKLLDREIYRVPTGEAGNAIAILKLVSSLRPDADFVDVTSVTRMSQQRVDASNLVYIQYYSQLGTLRSPILHMSGFAPTADFNEIKDTVTGQVYLARTADENTNSNGTRTDSYNYDFGYIASVPRPSGSHHIFIAGIDDTGLSQMVRLVSDKQQLEALAKRAKGMAGFEALYQIRTVGGLVFDTQLLVVRPLSPDRPGAPAH